MRIVIVDYGMGNLRSVENALRSLGISSIVSQNAAEVLDADAVILPGVGAFRDGMAGLRRNQLDVAIRKIVAKGKPLLGICLGMQMLLDKSYEFGEHAGLGLISGEVLAFQDCFPSDSLFKIPHMGWNSLSTRPELKREVLSGITSRDDFYFVHSFFVRAEDPKNVRATTEYGGIVFDSVIQNGSVIGCQFHPEKSGMAGMRVLQNFASLMG